MTTDEQMMKLAERDAALPKCHCGHTAYMDDVNGLAAIFLGKSTYCMVCFNLWYAAGEPEECPCDPPMNKARIYAEFDVDEFGTIHTPGKFEAESWIAPIVYDWLLNGDPGEMVGDTNVYVLTDEDRATLELSESTYALTLSESDQGFVYVGTLDQSEYEQIEEEEFGDEFGD